MFKIGQKVRIKRNPEFNWIIAGFECGMIQLKDEKGKDRPSLVEEYEIETI